LENVFSYLVLWLWIGDKVLWVSCTFEKLVEKTKGQKMNVNFLQPNWDESFDLGDRRQNTLKLLYFIMIINTISMPYKARPTTKVGNGIEDKKWKLWTCQNKELKKIIT
jgi:hypothetical protein